MGHKRDSVLCTNNVKQCHKYSPALPGEGGKGNKRQRNTPDQRESDAATTENSMKGPQKMK